VTLQMAVISGLFVGVLVTIPATVLLTLAVQRRRNTPRGAVIDGVARLLEVRR